MKNKKNLTKKSLAIEYGVAYNTFNKWIKNISELRLDQNQRLLTPKQIELIFKELGDPKE